MVSISGFPSILEPTHTIYNSGNSNTLATFCSCDVTFSIYFFFIVLKSIKLMLFNISFINPSGLFVDVVTDFDNPLISDILSNFKSYALS